jgi:hypothetical protein
MEYDPANCINRVAEQELFEGLLPCEDTVRLLTIRDKGGRGKTALLHRLKYICEWKAPRLPCSLVSLDAPALSGAGPFDLIQTIGNDLVRSREVSLRQYERYNIARMSKNFAPFTDALGDVTGIVNARDARVESGGVVTGVYLNHPVFLPSNSWASPEQEETARERCIGAFFEDIGHIGESRTVVLLLDTWEKGHPVLRDWIVNHLLYHHCFDPVKRPPRLVIVLAGRVLPDFKMLLGDRYNGLVKSIESLDWERQHVAEFLEQQGFHFSDKDLDFVYGKIQEGYSLNTAVGVVAIYSSKI